MLISLVGLPACGKSTIARRLGRRLGVPVIDIDHEVESRAGRSIVALFAEQGESGFRDLEAECVEAALCLPAAVVATGGGAVLREATRQRLHDNSIVAYIHFPPDLLVGRLGTGNARPLLRGDDPQSTLRRLYAERDPLYRATAHVVIDGTGAPTPALAEQIASFVESLPAGAAVAAARASAAP